MAHLRMMEMIALAITASKFYFVDFKLAFQEFLCVFGSNSQENKEKENGKCRKDWLQDK